MATIAQRLLAHYDWHARALPWRAAPGASECADPYRVWLSEIMLQQTTVAAVIPYFLKFTQRWPTVDALARAQDADLMAAWAGLGYYARARNLLACARHVSDVLDGRFPDEEVELLRLPGIGPYTAAAIAAIAFKKRAVVIDANVERVVARLYAIATPLAQAKAEIRAAAEAITPTARAGDFAQAMMDLGAGLCSLRDPQCLLCPLRSGCAGHTTGNPTAFPVKSPKADKPHRRGTVWWLERADGHVWLERRTERGMLGGMRGLPGTLWDKRGREDEHVDPPLMGQWAAINRPVEHVFTHFTLTLTVQRLVVQGGDVPAGTGEWWPIDELDRAGLPTLFAKAARIFQKGGIFPKEIS
ncbi:MAG: A/G-specific adenine glycosylase [Sphingobium sp.]